MGGKGSGRLPAIKKLIGNNRQPEFKTPIATEIFIPNHSGISTHPEVGLIDHDALYNFVANEHIDWTNATQNLQTSGNITTTGTQINLGVLGAANQFQIYGNTAYPPLLIRGVGHTTASQADILVDSGVNRVLKITNTRAGFKLTTTVDELKLGDSEKILLGAGSDGEIYSSSDDLIIANVTQDKDIFFNINDGGSTNTIIVIDGSSSRVGIGEGEDPLVPSAKLEVQTNPTDNIACLCFDQNNSGERFADFEGVSGASVTAPISTFATAGGIEGWIQIQINGDKKWLAYYSDPSA